MANEFRVKNGLIIDEASSSAGNLTLSDGDITSDATMTIGTTGNGANAIYLHANGGTSETIKIHADQGSGAGSIELTSDAGGVDVNAAGLISLETTAGSMEIGTAVIDGQTVTIGPSGKTQLVLTPHGTASSENIRLTNSAGTDVDAVDIEAAAGGITLDAAADITLDAGGGDVFLKDGGSAYGSLTNSSGSLHIYSGATAVLKMGTNSVAANAAFMGDLTVNGTTQVGSAANFLQVNAGNSLDDTVEARLYSSSETPTTISDVGNVLVLDNGNKAFDGAQGVVMTIGSSAATDSNTETWYWGTAANVADAVTLGYTDAKHWDTSSYAGSSACATDVEQSLLRITTAGKMTVGKPAGQSDVDTGPMNKLQVTHTSADGADGILILRANTTTGDGALLGSIGFDSTDGAVPSSNLEAAAYIASYATEAMGTGDKGGELVFGISRVDDDDDTTSFPVMKISSSSSTTSWVEIGNGSASAGELRLYEDTDDGSAYVAIKAPALNSNTSYTLTLPTADGTNGYVLSTDGGGTLSWISAAGLQYDGSTANGMLTYKDADEISVESNLTFTGSHMHLTGTFTVGTDDTGHDVKFFGATSGQYMLWDESADELVLTGDSKLSFNDAAGGENIVASADGHLEINAGTTLDITAPTVDLNTATEFNIDTATYDLNASGVATMDASSFTFTSDTATFTSSNASDPLVVIKNTANDAAGARLRLVKDKGAAGADGDDIGIIEFYGDDDAQDQVLFAKILAEIADASNGAEGGKLSLGVATHDAEMQYGIILTDGDAEDEVDITIGSGSSSVTTIQGDLVVQGTTTTVNSTTITIDDLSFNIAADITASSSMDGAGIVLGAANYDSGSAFANNPSLLYDHTGTRWEFSAHDVEVRSTTASSSTTTGALIVGGGAGIAADLYVGDDLRLLSDSAVFAMGAGNDFTITHDGTTGATIAGNPITIDAEGDITLDANGADIVFKDDGTGFGTITNSSGDMQIKAASGQGIEVRSNTDMVFLIEDDAPSGAGTSNIFQFTTEATTGTDLDNVDAEMEPLAMQYTSGTTNLGRTEYGKVTASSNTAGDVFTYDGAAFGVAEVTLHLTDGATQQVNRMLIIADTTGTDALNYSNYSVLYSDGSTELGTFAASIASDGTVTVEVDADDNDIITYMVNFLA